MGSLEENLNTNSKRLELRSVGVKTLAESVS
jgi:hypothetical protein